MTVKEPQKIDNALRIKLELENKAPRLDDVLLLALREQDENESLKEISKAQFKKLFTDKKVLIKGQNAKAKSPVNDGITFVDIITK